MQKISRFQWEKKGREKTWYGLIELTQHIFNKKMLRVTELYIHLGDVISADRTVPG